MHCAVVIHPIEVRGASGPVFPHLFSITVTIHLSASKTGIITGSCADQHYIALGDLPAYLNVYVFRK